MKEIREVTNKWEDISCSRIGILNIVKTTTLPEVIYRLSAILMKRPMAFLQK